MKEFFRKLFNIYAGEEKNAFLFACLGFLWAFGITSGLKFGDALFLIHVGADSLPIAYALTACTMIILAAFLLKAFHLISIHRIFICVLLCGALFYIVSHFCFLYGLGTQTKWLWFALKIVGGILFSVLMTCFWSFIDQYYHLQDAKRLYSLFTSAIFLGVAATGLLMRSGWIDFSHLTLAISAMLLFSAFWVVKIVNSAKPVYDESVLESNRGERRENTFTFLFQSILKSRFTMLLMIGNFLIYLFLVTTEYNYLSAFDDYFDPGITSETGGEEHAKLTLFLGQCLAVVSFINLIFGLFLYSRFVRRFGVNNLIITTPLFLLITYAGWSVSPSLLFPIMGFFVVEGMLYIIDDNNFTLLLNAVPPKVKYKIRLIIESFFEPIGMLVSSMLILFSPIDSKTLGLILAGFALIIALFLRKQYIKGIYISLSENAIHFQRNVQDWLVGMSLNEKKSTERHLLGFLQRSDEKTQLTAMEALLSFDDPSFLPRVLQRADLLSPFAKIAFLNMAAKCKLADNPQVLDRIYAWLVSTSDKPLIGALHFYLAKLGLLEVEEAVRDLDSKDAMRKGAAIIALKKSWPDMPYDVVRAQHDEASIHLQKLLQSSEDTDVCVGILVLGILENTTRGAEYIPFLLTKLTSSNDSQMRESCLLALGKIGSTVCVKPILESSIHFLPNERRIAQAAICQIGVNTVPILLDIIKDLSMHDRSRILAGRILGRLALTELRANLYDIVSTEIERAYFYFYHQHYIQNQYPEYDLTILRDDLDNSFHSVIDFIIQLLGVAGESEDCELLSQAQRSPNPKVRSHVLETLERTCEPRIYRALYPLIADLPHEEKMRVYLKEGHAPLSLTELLDKMSQSSIQGDQIVAIALKYRLNLPNWRDSLREQLSSKKEIFHHFAYELLET